VRLARDSANRDVSRAFYRCCELLLVLKADTRVFAAFDGVEVVQEVLQEWSVFVINRIHFFFTEETFFALKEGHGKGSKRKINCRELRRARRQGDDDREWRCLPLAFLELQKEQQNLHDGDGAERAFPLVSSTLVFRGDFPDSM